MTDLTLVSVVIPCLTRAHFLVPTIKSLLQQDYPCSECIVVGGGSTNAKVEILKRSRQAGVQTGQWPFGGRKKLAVEQKGDIVVAKSRSTNEIITMSINRVRRLFLPVHEKSFNCILSKFGASLIEHPITLVDVGASGGPIPRFLAFKGYIKTVGFEPDEMAFSELIRIQDNDTVYLNKALYNESGEIDFYINKNRATSSFLLADQDFLAEFPNPQDYDPAEIIRMNVATLDEALTSANIDDVDFIKLDTQGTELLILQGGLKMLANCFGIEIEIEFCPVYKHQPLFADVDDFLRKQGYILFDIHPIYWKRAIGLEYGKSKGQLVWGEALYFKGDSFFEGLQEKKDIDKFLRLLKAVLILTLYGYLDYALKITGEFRKMIKDENIVDNLITLESCLIKKAISGRLPGFHYRRRMAKLFYSLFKTFRLGYEKHSISGEELGNY